MVDSSKHGQVASQVERVLPTTEISHIESGTDPDPTDATLELLPTQSVCQFQ